MKLSVSTYLSKIRNPITQFGIKRRRVVHDDLASDSWWHDHQNIFQRHMLHAQKYL